MTRFIIISVISVIIYGCECVPGIDAPKVISPENSTNCLFINAIEDNNDISFLTDEIQIVGKVNYLVTNNEFKKVKIGNSYIKIIANDGISSIYNSPVEFLKDKNYILGAAGKGFDIHTLVAPDYINSLDNEDYVKIINLAGNKNSLSVSMVFSSDTLVYQLNPISATEYIKIPENKTKMIFVTNQVGELEATIRDYQFEKNRNLLILKGNNFSSTKTLFIDVIGLEK